MNSRGDRGSATRASPGGGGPRLGRGKPRLKSPRPHDARRRRRRRLLTRKDPARPSFPAPLARAPEEMPRSVKSAAWVCVQAAPARANLPQIPPWAGPCGCRPGLRAQTWCSGPVQRRSTTVTISSLEAETSKVCEPPGERRRKTPPDVGCDVTRLRWTFSKHS